MRQRTATLRIQDELAKVEPSRATECLDPLIAAWRIRRQPRQAATNMRKSHAHARPVVAGEPQAAVARLPASFAVAMSCEGDATPSDHCGWRFDIGAGRTTVRGICVIPTYCERHALAARRRRAAGARAIARVACARSADAGRATGTGSDDKYAGAAAARRLHIRRVHIRRDPRPCCPAAVRSTKMRTFVRLKAPSSVRKQSICPAPNDHQ
jgi:hypothetical protein